jgi:hypothetical protein
MPAAVATRAEHVVEGQAGVVEHRRDERDAVDREQEWLDPDQVGRDREQQGAFRERLAHEPEMELFEIPKPAVDQPRRAG